MKFALSKTLVPKTIALLLAAATINAFAADRTSPRQKSPEYQHVLVVSIDGMHALDLHNYIATHPHSALAALARSGVEYTEAHTVRPADSFPGLLAIFTGGTPTVTGVYYDDTYARKLSPPGSACKQIGTAVVYDEAVDGPGAAAGKPALNPTLLPLDPQKHCSPVYPHDYLRVNTVFNVVRQAGGHTAWVDKHPAYEILNGPDGNGVEDLYTPEIGANFRGPEDSHKDKITASILRTERYDDSKADAVINEIDGFRHDGKTRSPVPEVFGLNLQSVNVGEKLAGYRDSEGTPTPKLENALANCDRLIGKMAAALQKQHLLDTTLVIVTAKHGNGPIDPRAVRHVDKKVLAKVVESAAPHLQAHITPDQGALIWLRDQRETASVVKALDSHRQSLGISKIIYGQRLQLLFPSPRHDSRTPDIIVIPQRGVIYAKHGDKKKAEHGGLLSDDTHVALLLSNPHLSNLTHVVRTPVFTTQIAPTILADLGISPQRLDAVRLKGTMVLPGA